MFKDFFDTVKQKYNEYVREYQAREQRKLDLEEIKKNSEFKPGEAEALEREAALRHQNNLREQREAERLDAQNFFSPEANLRAANEAEAHLKQMINSSNKQAQPNPSVTTEAPKPAGQKNDEPKNSPSM